MSKIDKIIADIYLLSEKEQEKVLKELNSLTKKNSRVAAPKAKPKKVRIISQDHRPKRYEYTDACRLVGRC